MPKILLVEDDPMISEIYQTKFQSAGFETDIAETGKAVLSKVKEKEYDVVLLDLVLPEMGGMEVLRELRTNPAYSPDLKVVIFSNLSEREDREKALELGANGFVPKTEFAPSRLLEEVKRFLRQFEEQKKNEHRVESEASVTLKDKKILFVEDETVFVEMFGGRLEQEGYQVTYLSGGADKVREALKEPFDLVITDMAIQGMTGKDVIAQTKASDANASTPIILFSASVDEQYVESEDNYGADRYHLKTRLTPTELVREAEALLMKSESNH